MSELLASSATRPAYEQQGFADFRKAAASCNAGPAYGFREISLRADRCAICKLTDITIDIFFDIRYNNYVEAILANSATER